jgi:hypothetical protein
MSNGVVSSIRCCELLKCDSQTSVKHEEILHVKYWCQCNVVQHLSGVALGYPSGAFDFIIW